MNQKHMIMITRDIGVIKKAVILLQATAIKDMTENSLMRFLMDPSSDEFEKIQELSASIGINTQQGSMHIALAIVGMLDLIAQSCFLVNSEDERNKVNSSFLESIALRMLDISRQNPNMKLIETLTPDGIVDMDGNVLKFKGRSVNHEKA